MITPISIDNVACYSFYVLTTTVNAFMFEIF